ncbi:CHAT domain-containing protein [Mycena vulgaris]|nr:CHAT domain-containing protein [Mycena vulgaris]
MYSGETDPWALETFRRVVGSIVVLNTPFSLGTLEKILDLRRADKHRPVDVTHFVKQLRTVLVIGTDKITRDTIPHLHKSFFEFVTSTNIRPDLRVSLLSSHKELAPKCVAHSAEVGDSYFHAARSSYRWIVEALLDDDQNISAYLICFSDLEWSNYQHSGEVSSLDTAIFAVTRLIKLTPDLHNEKPQYFTKLCTLYRTRYQRLGNLEDIDSSLQSMRAAVSLIPDGHPDQAHHLRNLVDSIRDRYKRLGELHDLEEGLQYMQMAAALTPEEDPDFPLCLRGLAHSFRDRYKRLGDLTDLEMALENIHRAVELTPQGHPEQPGHLHSLAVSIRDRFQRFGELQDLERAVLFSQEAVTLTPVGHPDLPHRLRSLADSCREKYKRFGDLMDLETALEVIQQAIDYIPEWHPDRAHYLKSLAISLTERYQRLGDSEDSEDSLGLLRECLVLIPEGHPDRPQYLRSLAVSVWDRFHRLRDIHDLEDTLRLLEEAVASTPIGHPDQPEHLQIQAASIRDRYQILGDLQDLEKILQILQEAIDITPEGHPDRSGQLHSLAVSFRAKYQTFGHLQDLDKALQLIHQAVALTPEGHPDLPSCLLSQASFSGDLYGATGNLQDLETAFGSYRKSFTMSSTHPMLAWEAALEWAHLEHRPSHILEAYAAAFDLLPEILWIGKSFHACQNARRQINITEVTSEVIKACIDLSNPRQAVEFLEKGLTTTFVHMQQLKTNFDHLPAHVAENFRQLSFELCSGTARNTKMLAAKRDSLLANIRNQPGFEDFLCPKRYSDLCQASQHGPIVILNSHKEHCDAIVLLNPVSDPLHIPLSEVSLDQLEALSIELNTNGLEGNIRLSGIRDPPFKPSQQSFQEILEWLWTHIVVHIYKALELHDIPNGRLWWLPTGAFKGLPLHAADLSDQYISSYTSNLESLLYLNSKEANHPPRLGIIGATSSQDSTSIQFPGVLEEVTKIAAIVGEANVHCLVGEKATMGAVNLQFQDCSWIHVAGHGNQDLDEPLKSFIQLHDGHLELGAIIRMNLSNPDFAFLATCKSVTRKTDEVDMAGGFNVAGFRGVIGTMWTMDDKDGPVAAESFYTKLFANGRKPKVSDTAQALQLAVRELRDRGVPYRRWVPFIHMGI